MLVARGRGGGLAVVGGGHGGDVRGVDVGEGRGGVVVVGDFGHGGGAAGWRGLVVGFGFAGVWGGFGRKSG